MTSCLYRNLLSLRSWHIFGLATNGISIAELVQPDGREVVPLVIKTHKAKEKMMQHAFQELNRLAVVKKGAVMIRFLDDSV